MLFFGSRRYKMNIKKILRKYRMMMKKKTHSVFFA